MGGICAALAQTRPATQPGAIGATADPGPAFVTFRDFRVQFGQRFDVYLSAEEIKTQKPMFAAVEFTSLINMHDRQYYRLVDAQRKTTWLVPANQVIAMHPVP